MPEQLSSQLIELRERCAAFAKDHMLPLADGDRAMPRMHLKPYVESMIWRYGV